MRFFLALWAILANLYALDSGDLIQIFSANLLYESALNNRLS